METEDLIGTRIKGYELKEFIDRGGFGAVYRATQASVGRDVAVKVILPKFANQPEFIRRFESEAQTIAHLEHLHITPLHDYWRDPEGAYLVMRYLRGGSLQDALQSGPFSLEAAATLLDQVASALSAAHRNKVVHRDIKPSNILLDEDGNAYLTDFGIAKSLDLDGAGQTGTGVILGSTDYLAPEQARSEAVSPQTDIYSLGITLFETLAGRHPYPGESMDRLFKHLNEPVPRLETLDPEVVEGINAVIQKATQKDPAARYADVLQMAAEFREAARLSVSKEIGSLVELLTPREQEVLQLMLDGRSNREIADRLTVELVTVKWYVRQIYKKLNVRSRVQAMVKARELNLVAAPKDAATTGALALPEPDNPYKGLRPFQAADEQDFFGREKLVRKIIARLLEDSAGARFLALVGPSGSGKSSLARAGLVPALWKGELPGSDKWYIVDMIPGEHPFDELEVALTRIAAQPVSGLADHLTRDKRGLLRAAQLILPDDGSELLLVIDQFEEVFTLLEDETQRQLFLDLLTSAVLEPRSRVRVVVTLRADFYDRPLEYPDFGALLRDRVETVLPLSAEELERAITGPANRVGVGFEDGLVSTIVNSIHYQPGALPLLQYALTELFELRDGRTLTHAAYQEIGGAVGALARRAEELYQELDEGGRETVRQMFLRLVTLGEGVEDTRRRVPRGELLAIAPEPERMEEAIDTFAAYRLLSLDNDPATRAPTVEVAHEAILREWERLRTWLNEGREDIRLQRQLARAAGEWEDAERDPSFLLRGARLAQFESWSWDSDLMLTPTETAYLEASLAGREAREAQEAARAEREKHLEVRSRNFLRALVGVFAAAALIAILLSVFANNQRLIALGEAAGRATQQALAVEKAQIADEQAALADASAAQALAESQARATQQALAEDQRQIAEEQRGIAEEQLALRAREAQVNHSLLLAAQSQAALDASNLDLALALAVEANRIDNPPGQAQMALSEAAYAPGGTIRLFEGHDRSGRVFGVAVSPDGKHMLSGSESGEVFWWDLASGEIIQRLEGHSGWVWRVAISPDGRYGLSAGQTGIIYWDLETGTPIHIMTDIGELNDVAFSPDGSLAASAHGGAPTGDPELDDNSVRLWDLQSGTETRRIEFGDRVRGLAFSPDGARIAAISWAERVVVLDVSTGETLVQSGQEIADLNAVAFGPDGSYVIVTGQPAGTQGWRPVRIDLDTGEELPFIGQHNFSGMVAVKISPDGSRVVSAGGGYQVWDLESRDLLWTGAGNSDGAFLPDGSGVAITQDEFVRLVSLENGGLAEGPQLPLMETRVAGLAYSPDGLRALVTGYDVGTLGEYDLETGALVHRFERDPEAVPSTVGVTYSPDGKTALSAHFFDGSLSYWDVATREELMKLSLGGELPWAVAFHPNGGYALGAGSYTGPEATGVNQLVYWDLSTGEPVWIVDPDYTVKLRGVAINPNGETALTGGAQQGLSGAPLDMWDLEDGNKILSLEGHVGVVWDIEYVDEYTALTAAEDATLILWDLRSGQPIRHFYGHTRGVKAIALNPDRSLAASIAREGTVIIWDIASGQPLRRYHGHPEEGTWLEFSPDGVEVMSAGQLGEVFRWRVDATLADLLAWVMENRHVREFTCVERVIYNIEPLCGE